MSDSNTLEKLKVISVAVDYALKAGRVWDSNLYHGGMYNCPPIKDVLNFMGTFHALDAFVYGTCAEDNLFGCDPANPWTIQVGYSESAPKYAAITAATALMRPKKISIASPRI